jgi:hypothetical protein
MIKGCENCRLIPAGVSRKTGNEYKAFYVCDNEDCPNYKPKTGYAPKKRQESLGIDKAALFDYLEEKFGEVMTEIIKLQK